MKQNKGLHIRVNKLLQYSLLSAAFITCKQNDLLADVVYTDVEPDVVLDENNESCILDIDNNGSIDFALLNRTFNIGGYWTSGSIYYIPFQQFERLLFSVYNGNNVAGKSINYGTPSSELFRAIPYAISAGDIIFEAMSFQNNDQQLLALRTFISIIGEFYYYGGDWYPEQFDHYLGIHFKDTEEITHYGWIRCDVKDEGRTLVIKEYAYETEPDYPIVAGDTTHYVDINNIQNSIDASVYGFGRDIYILTETFQNTEVVIYDLYGKQIISEVLQSKSESISMTNYPAGIYLVTLLNDGKRFDKKVFIE